VSFAFGNEKLKIRARSARERFRGGGALESTDGCCTYGPVKLGKVGSGDQRCPRNGDENRVARAVRPRTILEELRAGRHGKRRAHHHYRKHEGKKSQMCLLLGFVTQRSAASIFHLMTFRHLRKHQKCRLEDGSTTALGLYA
jgi:hypothetical protein